MGIFDRFKGHEGFLDIIFNNWHNSSFHEPNVGTDPRAGSQARGERRQSVESWLLFDRLSANIHRPDCGDHLRQLGQPGPGLGHDEHVPRIHQRDEALLE
jgi:hypothetical protein